MAEIAAAIERKTASESLRQCMGRTVPFAGFCGEGAVFEREAAAVAIVGDLRDLILQRFVLNVVAHAASEIKPFAIETSVTDKRADLVGERLQGWIVLNVEVGHSGEEFAVWFYLTQRSFGDRLVQLL